MKKEKKKDGELFIELKKNILEILDEYTEEAGMKKEDIAFASGYLKRCIEKAKIGDDQFVFLLQAYFFAGVYYAKTYQFNYERLSAKERNKKIEDLKHRVDIVLKAKKEKSPDYMG